MPALPDYIVKNFIDGTITRIEKETLPKGAASDSLNWLTRGDHIELRRGYALVGVDKTGTGRITGLRVGRRFDGTQVIFSTYGRKVQYYDTVTEDHIEVGTNLLPSAANNLDVCIEPYYSLAGSMIYIGGPDVGFFKIPVANPGSAVDQSVTNHKGLFAIKQNRTILWQGKDSNGGSDPTGLYGSYVDRDELSDYTQVTAESLGGSGSTTYSGTLATAGAPKTIHFLTIQATVAAGTETFQDSRNGTLTSNFGGTGTINYATGAYSVTFSDTTTGGVTADYYTETATSSGILDFSKSTPRTAGQGFVFRQDDGGSTMQNVGSLGDAEMCLHTLKTWKLVLSNDDTNATNLIYRSKVGIPYWRAKVDTGEGVYIIDSADENNAYVRLLTFEEGSDTNIIPKSVSDKLNLENYRFDEGVLFEWGEYLILIGRHKDSTDNDTMWVRHRQWGSWDRLDYALSTVDIWNGTLIGGSSISNNVFQLFSGLVDEEANIENQWTSGKVNCDAEGMKTANLFVIDGNIGPEQSIDVYLSLDEGPFVLKDTISGGGSYVDKTQQINVGSHTIGSTEIGGGTSADVEAYHYRREFRINTDRFEYIRVKFVATGVGYASVSEYQIKDIRYKGRSIPVQYSS